MSRTPGSSGSSPGGKPRSRARGSAGAAGAGSSISTGSEKVTGLGAAPGGSGSATDPGALSESLASKSTGNAMNSAAAGLGAAVGGSEPPRVSDNVIERSSLQPVNRPQPSPPQVLEGMPASSEVPPEDRLEDIARSAYYRAEKRGFIPGYELDDWLEAEREYLERDGGLDLR